MAVVALTHEQHAQKLADYLPGGRLFRSKNIANSNTRKLLLGIAHELFTADGYLRDFQEDIAPSVTIYFISEWEKALGIPDDCFTGNGALDERRRDILIKLASLGVQTAADFVSLAALFGIDVTIESGIAAITFPLTFPVLMFDTEKDARFTIIVNSTVDAASRFPFTFPITFGDATLGTLECLLTKLKPANCDIIFRQV